MDEHIITAADSPCFLKIRPSVQEVVQAPVPPSDTQHVIGARLSAAPRRTLPSTAQATGRGSFRGAGASGSQRSAEPVLPGPTPSTAFERFVVQRIATLETQQLQLVRTVNTMQESIASLASIASTFVSGGGGEKHRDRGSKRQFPFSKSSQPVPKLRASGSGRALSASTVDEADLPPCRVTLVYHGSFAPFHRGHRACLATAIKFLQEHEVTVVKAVVGCTLPAYLEQKIDVSGFEDAVLRSKIICAVLGEVEALGAPVVVDEHPHRTSEHLARKHAAPNTRLLYLKGSDLQKRPSSETLIVTRTSADLRTANRFCRESLSGICVQTSDLDVTSTSMRDIMKTGKVPGKYGAEARKLINAVVYKVFGKPAAAASQLKKPRVGAKAVSTPQVSGSSHSHAAQLAVPVPASTTCQQPASTSSAASAAPVLLQHAPCSQVTSSLDYNFDPQLTVSKAATNLRMPGTMKLQQPIFYHLGTYWKNCIAPMCALLQVRPMLAIRRSDQPEVRVPYLPIRGHQPPVFLSLDVDTSRDLRAAVSQIGGLMVACWHLSFDLSGFTSADADPDTDRGRSVRLLLSNCAAHVDRCWELAAVPVAIFLVDVAQLVLLARPAYWLSATSVAVDAQILINNFLCEQQLLDGFPSQLIAVISAERSVSFVQGGGPKSRGHTPEEDGLTTCFRAILAKNGRFLSGTDADCSLRLRSAAQHWLRNAWKQHWMCAGKFINSYASQAQCEPEHFLDHVCCPEADRIPPEVLVDALAAFYSVNAYLLNPDGQRTDGYVRCSGHGIIMSAHGWEVVDHLDRPLAVPYVPLSPTEPFIDFPSSSDVFVEGAGKVVRVQHDSVSLSVCNIVTQDIPSSYHVQFSAEFIKHLVVHDRKCCLACFQAKTVTQRLHALSAACRRMGLLDKVELLAPLILASRTGQAAPAATPATAASDAPPPTLQPLSEVWQRINALEAWAHSWDASNLGDAEAGPAAVRARELLEAMAKQAAADYAPTWCASHDEVLQLKLLVQSQSHRLQLLESRLAQCSPPGMQLAPPPPLTPSCSSAATATVAGMNTSPVEQDALVSSMQADLDLLCSKVSSLERQSLKSDSFAVDCFREMKFQISELRTFAEHASHLIGAHTQAVGQSWQWIISLIQATQETAARVSVLPSSSLPTTPPPAAPHRDGAEPVQFGRQQTGRSAEVLAESALQPQQDVPSDRLPTADSKRQSAGGIADLLLEPLILERDETGEVADVLTSGLVNAHHLDAGDDDHGVVAESNPSPSDVATPAVTDDLQQRTPAVGTTTMSRVADLPNTEPVSGQIHWVVSDSDPE
eukprot:2479569-Amphidinium_carterae.2